MAHFWAQIVSLKKNKKRSGALKGWYQSSKNKSTSLLFQLCKYHYEVFGHSLHKQGSDYKLWEWQGIQPPIQDCHERWCISSMTVIKGNMFAAGM